MSSTATPSKPGATFLWILGAFACFAVLFYVIQGVFAKQGEVDPRIPQRLANKEEIDKAQNEVLAKMGFKDAAKKEAVFAKTIETLKTKPAAASSVVVPGSPTQLKQAAAPAPAAAAPAPATAPAPAPAAPAATPPAN